MPGEVVAVDPRLVVVAVDVGVGDQPAQVLVARVVLGQQDQVEGLGVGLALLVGHRPAGDVGLDPDDRLDALGLGRLVERHGAVERAVVRDGHRIHALGGRRIDQLGDPAEPVEQAELRVDVEVREVVRGDGRHGGSMVVERRSTMGRATPSRSRLATTSGSRAMRHYVSVDVAPYRAARPESRPECPGEHRRHTTGRAPPDRLTRNGSGSRQGGGRQPDRLDEGSDGASGGRSCGSRRSTSTRRGCRRIHRRVDRDVAGVRVRRQGPSAPHRHIRRIQPREARSPSRAWGTDHALVRSDRGQITEQLIRTMIEVASGIAAETGAWWVDQLNNRDAATG